MKRPLVWVASFYVAGVLLGDLLEPPFAALFTAAVLTAVACFALTRLRPALLALLIVLTGWTAITLRTAVLSPYDLRLLIAGESELVSLRGHLTDTPSWRLHQRKDVETTNTLADVQVNSLRQGEGWRPAFGSVAVSTRGPLGPGFFTGRLVEITGVLRTPKPAPAEGLFDYRSYLARRGIYYQLSADSTNDWRIVEEPGASTRPPLADRFRVWGQATLARGLPSTDEALRLNWAMVLGWTTALTSEVSAPFMRSGTMHIFAISGLHIALIAGILVSLLRVIRVPRAACGIVVIPAIWFYTAATGWQASAIRSTIMMTVIIVGWALNRPGDLLNSLAASAFIILVWDPQQLFQASFQLSFFAVLSLALLLPPIEHWRQRLLRHDPLLPDELLPRWRRWLDPPLRHVTTALATSLAAWVGSAPIVAFYFHFFTPVSLLANLIVIPLSSLALMCGLGSLLCGAWFPALSVLFNHSGWFWMTSMVRVSQWCADLPGGCVNVAAPGVLEFVAYYALLAGVATGWLLERGRWKWACPAAAMLAVVAGVMVWNQRPHLELVVLPLRGGDAIVVDSSGRADDLLIDCGDESAAQGVVVPFLRARGWNRVPNLLLTHGDVRHVGGAGNLVAQFRVRQLVTSAVRFRSTAYRLAIEAVTGASNGSDARLQSAPRQCLNHGERIGAWRVLHPDRTDRFALADDQSLVLLGDFEGTRVLFCSDLGRAAQQALLERERDLRADIVVAGLPTGAEPLGDALLDVVRPQVIILSTGEYPSSERLPLPLLARLRRRGLPVLDTNQDGAVTLEVRPRSWQIRTAWGTSLRGTPAAPMGPG